jgi:hypothetical protein
MEVFLLFKELENQDRAKVRKMAVQRRIVLRGPGLNCHV